ncbi:LysE family translocator [Oceanobacillus sp. CAU 1775]
MGLFISGLLIGFSLVLQIGTANVGLIRTGIKNGFLPAFIFSLGCAVGDGLYATLAVYGVALLLQSSALFQIVMWIVGTIMLLYLAFQAFKDVVRPKELSMDVDAIEKKSLLAYFFTGFILVVSSPTGLIWFATVAGSVVSSAIGSSEGQSVLPFIIGFVLISAVWGAVLAYISSVGGRLMGNKMIRIFSLVSGLLFLYFAYFVFTNGLENIF